MCSARPAGLKTSQTTQSSRRKHLSTMIAKAKRGERKVKAPWGPCQSFPSRSSRTYSWNSLQTGVKAELIFDVWALVQDHGAVRIIYQLRWQLWFCLRISKYFMNQEGRLILLTVRWAPYWSQVTLNNSLGKAVWEDAKIWHILTLQ